MRTYQRPDPSRRQYSKMESSRSPVPALISPCYPAVLFERRTILFKDLAGSERFLPEQGAKCPKRPIGSEPLRYHHGTAMNAGEDQPTVARQPFMPPRNAATSRVPAAASSEAACEERLSVRHTMTSGRPWAASSGMEARNSASGTLRAPSICP